MARGQSLDGFIGESGRSLLQDHLLLLPVMLIRENTTGKYNVAG
jgi:hypothetical protein